MSSQIPTTDEAAVPNPVTIAPAPKFEPRTNKSSCGCGCIGIPPKGAKATPSFKAQLENETKALIERAKYVKTSGLPG